MRYLDVCAGISASTVAWRPLGWEAAAYSEIEAAPRAVLAHHYPDTPLHGDFTTIQGDEYGPIDLLVGGTPCQDFSVAGLRKGLAGERGNLTLEYLRLADRARPRWVVWENVPGVLSIDGGRAFGAFLGGLAQLGYGFAYRVLDAQYFGVPQRRRRVFVVGCIGDWRGAAAVLLERHSMSGHPAPRRSQGARIADDAGDGLTLRSHWDGDYPHPTLNQSAKGSGGVGASNQEIFSQRGAYLAPAHTLRGEGFDASEDGTGRGTPLVPVCFSAKDHGADASEIAPTLRAGGHVGSHANAGVMPAIAYAIQERAVSENIAAGPQGKGWQEDVAYTLEARHHAQAVAFAQNSRDEVRLFDGDGGIVGALGAEPGMKQQCYVATTAVRKLTPRECERLQGFPDDYTLVAHRGKAMADGPRYKALGNSMAVPVMRWIGERIAAVEAITERLAA